MGPRILGRTGLDTLGLWKTDAEVLLVMVCVGSARSLLNMCIFQLSEINGIISALCTVAL